MTSSNDVTVSRRLPWTWIGLGLLLIGLIVAGRLLPFAAWLEQFNVWIADSGPAGILLYAAVYAAAAVLFVPGSILTIGGGFAFGLGWGTAAVSLGSTTAAALAFLIARYAARDKVAAMAAGNDRFRAIDRAVAQQGWKIVFLLRLSPLIPFSLSNYLYGLTAVPFWHYVGASWIAMLPATVLYVYLGVAGKAGLEAASGQAAGADAWRTVLLVAGLAATVAVSWYVTRIARRALAETELG